jgi:tetratricopeptide (TPR) repeat protein
LEIVYEGDCFTLRVRNDNLFGKNFISQSKLSNWKCINLSYISGKHLLWPPDLCNNDFMSVSMNNWREIMDEAEQAKRQMLVDRKRGEAMFADLIQRVNSDGMVFFKRAEAYEVLSELELALEDFRSALAFFPMLRWKRIAKEGLYRVEHQLRNQSRDSLPAPDGF